MAMYEFFESCLNTAKDKFEQLVKIPRARGGSFNDEIKELISKVETARDYGELTEEQSKYLIKEFNKIDFTKLSEARAANKERESYNVKFRYYR